MTGWGTRSLCYCQPSHPPSQSTLKFSQFSHIYITIVISAFIYRHFISRYTRFSFFIISFNNVFFPPFASTIFGSFFIFKTCIYFFITRTNRAILTVTASTSRSTRSASFTAGATVCLTPLLARTTPQKKINSLANTYNILWSIPINS